MTDAPDNDDEDTSLFRQAIGPVRRMEQAPAPPSKPRPRPVPRMTRADEQAATSEFRQALGAMPIGAGDVLSHRVPALPVTVFNRLKRGQFSIQEELDLHGATASQAETLLRHFLDDAQRSGTGCVRIIHGKGLGSDAEIPVLKNVVDRVLRHRSDVLAFHSALPAQGGTGAVVVLLAAR